MSKRKQNDPANQTTSRRQFLQRSAGALAFAGSVWIQSHTHMRAVSAPMQTKPFALDVLVMHRGVMLAVAKLQGRAVEPANRRQD